MHPAMFLRGSQARFTDPATGDVVQPGSVPHPFGEFVMAAVAPDSACRTSPSLPPTPSSQPGILAQARYIGWPMLVVLSLET